MGNNYVSIIAVALQEYATGVTVPEGVEPEQMYKDLAWAGIWRMDSGTIFDNLINGTDKARILNRKNTEMQRNTTFGMTPSSNNPCLP